MIRRFVIPGVVLYLIGCLAARGRAMTPPPSNAEATITSDQLELLDNGARSVFTGHVVLKQDPYLLLADRMIQTKATGIVDAYGHIHGTWITDKGEKVLAEGAQARYIPSEQTTELWGRPRLTRWETALDTAPVTITAVRFIARQKENAMWAIDRVYMRQGTGVWAKSDEAKYDQNAEVIHLWGKKHRTHVYWSDTKGIADFESDRGWLCLAPKKARLMDRVHGHITPL
jgi:lipopolysaccharide transport protein LptA